MATEKELDRALEKALREDVKFRQWFINKTRFRGISPEQIWLRSNYPFGKATLNLRNDQTGETELLIREGETDVLFVFQAKTGRRLALHIENKLASGKFMLYQEGYEARAKAWVGKQKYWYYDEWDTVLLAPLSFVNRHATEAQKFGATITHEQVSDYVPIFGGEEQ